jgi:N-succinyldiaminopimelate aminotransferase
MDVRAGDATGTRGAGLVRRMRGFETTIFAEMSALAARTGAVNLGQGFPDAPGPASVLDGAVSAIRAGLNQYPPGRGVPRLRQAVADHQRRFYGLDVDPDTEVLVTVGATEALTASVLALCEPGDEVVTFEPYFDSYAAAIALAGAVRRTVPLRFPDYALDVPALESAVTPRTRLLLLNSPHNPTGKVFSASELAEVARVAIENDLLVVTDEVYEHLTSDGVPHIPLAALPGMAERTVTVSSAGKTFSVTGWKVGWAHARPHLLDAVVAVKQWLTFAGGSPFQHAVADALALPDEVYAGVSADLQHGRDRLLNGLAAAGFGMSWPRGTYFVVVDAAPLGFADGAAFCRRLPELAGVVGIPVQMLADDRVATASLVRFAYCKGPEVLDEACRRLAGLRPGG